MNKLSEPGSPFAALLSTLKALAVAILVFAGASAFAAAEPGKDYTLLNPPQPTETRKIEVLEFFFYGCPHCYRVHPLLSEWEKTMPGDVQLTLVPTVFRDSWEPMAYTFYALQSMGQRERLHDALYRAWNEDNIDLSDEARIAAFVAKHGVDATQFAAAYHSFTVQSEVTRAEQMIRSYRINGTPTFVVDGKYVIEGMQPAELIRALKEVIVMARKSHQKK